MDDTQLLLFDEDAILCCHLEESSCPDMPTQAERGVGFEYKFVHYHMRRDDLLNLRSKGFRPAYVQNLSQAGAECKNARHDDVCRGINHLIAADENVKNALKSVKKRDRTVTIAEPPEPKTGAAPAAAAEGGVSESKGDEADASAGAAIDAGTDAPTLTPEQEEEVRHALQGRILANVYRATDEALGAVINPSGKVTPEQAAILEDVRLDMTKECARVLNATDLSEENAALLDKLRGLQVIYAKIRVASKKQAAAAAAAGAAAAAAATKAAAPNPKVSAISGKAFRDALKL